MNSEKSRYAYDIALLTSNIASESYYNRIS